MCLLEYTLSIIHSAVLVPIIHTYIHTYIHILAHVCGYTCACTRFTRVKVGFFVACRFVMRTHAIKQSWLTRHAPHKQTHMSACSINHQPYVAHHMNKLITSACFTIKHTWRTRYAPHE